MHVLFAPPKKFGFLPRGTPLLTPEVKFFNNTALCPKFFWAHAHKVHGCLDLSPRWMRRLRSSRKLKSILFMLSGGIGDVMWAMPVIRQVHTLYPEASIYVSAEPRTAHVFANFPYINSLIPDDFINQQKHVFICDEIYNFAGIATSDKREMRMEPVDACFHHIGIKKPSDPLLMLPHLVVTLDEGKKAVTLLQKNKIDSSRDTIISLSCETSTANRDWPIQYLYDLAAALAAKGYKVVLLGEKTKFSETSVSRCKCGYEFSFNSESPPIKLDYVCPSCAAIIFIEKFGLPPGVVDFSSSLSYRESLTIISLSDCLVGPASSLVIAATALHIPTVGLYGAFSPKRMMKYYTKFDYLYGKLDCSPCSEHWTECPHGHPAPCMKNIFPSMVFEKIVSMLRRFPRPPISKKPFE